MFFHCYLVHKIWYSYRNSGSHVVINTLAAIFEKVMHALLDLVLNSNCFIRLQVFKRIRHTTHAMGASKGTPWATGGLVLLSACLLFSNVFQCIILQFMWSFQRWRCFKSFHFSCKPLEDFNSTDQELKLPHWIYMTTWDFSFLQHIMAKNISSATNLKWRWHQAHLWGQFCSGYLQNKALCIALKNSFQRK